MRQLRGYGRDDSYYDIFNVSSSSPRHHITILTHRDFLALIVGAPRQGDADAPPLSVLAVEHNHLVRRTIGNDQFGCC